MVGWGEAEMGPHLEQLLHVFGVHGEASEVQLTIGGDDPDGTVLPLALVVVPHAHPLQHTAVLPIP